MISFLGPTRRSLVGLLLTIWQIAHTGARTFVWGAVREGAIDLRPLSRALRLLTIAGLLLIMSFLFSLLFNDFLRVNGSLEFLADDSTETRGLLVPSAAIPLTMAALALAWGYTLAGALHVRRDIRWAILLVYLLFGFLPLFSGATATVDSHVIWWILLAVPVLLVLCFLVLPGWALPLTLEWSLMMALHGAVLLLTLYAKARTQIISDGELPVSGLVSSLVQSSIMLIAPFLYVAGLGWADFGLEVSGWTARAVQRHATGLFVTLLLAAFLAYRLYSLIGGLLADGVDERQLGAWFGAALLCAGLAAIAAWRRRRTAGGEVPRRLLVLLILLALSVQFLLGAGVQLGTILALLNPIAPGAVALYDSFLQSVSTLSEQETRYRALTLTTAGLLIAWVAARRNNNTVVTYGLILALHQGLAWMTSAGRPLYALRYTYAEVDTIVLLVFAGLALFWLVRHRLTGPRALRLLGLALLMAVLNQTAFLDNPFSPLFGFAGVFFLVFGILWSILTAGGQFANTSSPGFPRASRLLLYIGYVLLSVSAAHWYLVSHNIDLQIVQSDFNFAGFRTFGLPLAFLALVEGGQRLVEEEISQV
jgi:hypothetical protein